MSTLEVRVWNFQCDEQHEPSQGDEVSDDIVVPTLREARKIAHARGWRFKTGDFAQCPGCASREIGRFSTGRGATRDAVECTCVENCAEDPRTACSLSGIPHVHPNAPGSSGFGPCSVHPDAPICSPSD